MVTEWIRPAILRATSSEVAMARRLLLTCLVLALFGAVACGGGDDGGQPDGGQPDSGMPDGGLPDGGPADGGPDGGRPDGGLPAVTFLSPTDGGLRALDPVILQYSETMSRDGLVIGGSLVAGGESSGWSTTDQTDDTLTLTPTTGWPEGDQSLSVDARTPDNRVSTLNVTLTVLAGNSAGFTQTPESRTASTSADFAFSCSPSGCSFTCSLDGAAAQTCSSPLSLTGLTEGSHSLAVTADFGGESQTFSYAWVVDLTPPQLVSASFTGYGQLQLTFDEPVDAAYASDSSRYSLSPVKPAGMAVASASASGKTVELTLSKYNLPRTYTLGYAVRDALGNAATGQSASLAGGDSPSRVAFVSAAHGNGNLLGWSALPAGSGATTGLQAADAICQSEAGVQGLAGTFRAFLSDGNEDAACRMRNLSGKWSDNCGQSSEPTTQTGPCIGSDGLPLVRSLSELLEGKWLRPADLLADGTVVTAPQFAWHATDVYSPTPGQATANNCSNWTSSSASGQVDVTRADAARSPFRIPAGSGCSATDALICVQVDAGGSPLNGDYRSSGKVAFVTAGTVSGAISLGANQGVAAADALCQTSAGEAGLANPTRFVAWLSTSTADAYCRVLGQSAGKRSDATPCGLATPPSTGPWVTTTGFPFAASLDALVTSGPELPLVNTETGGFAPSVTAWTGTLSDGTAGATCADWSSTTASSKGVKGQLPDLPQWTAVTAGAQPCNVASQIICLER
jgi:hypothetical protein